MKKIVLLYIILISIQIQAQQKKDSLNTQVIEVTHSFEPKVQDAYKLDVNPDVGQVTEQKIPVTYAIQSVPVASTFSPEKGGMTGFNAKSTIEEVKNSYVSLAGGNYLQIFGDAYLYYPVTDNLETAIRLKHYSSQGQQVDDGISYDPFSHTKADLLFGYKAEKSHWNFDMGYKGDKSHFKELFPLGPAFPGTVQKIYNYKFSKNNFNLDVEGTFKDLFIKDLSVSYNNYWDVYQNNENDFHLLGNLIFPVGNIDLRLGLQTDLVTGDIGKVGILDPKTDAKITYKNMDFGLLPAVQIENDKLVVNIGAKIFYQNQDTLYKSVQFIPDVKLNFNLIYEKLTVNAGVTGDLKQNAYHQFIQNNPYLISQNNILPTLIPYDIFGGFNGAFSSAFSYEVKLGFRRIKNYGFYSFSNTYAADYNLVYDDMNQSYFSTAFNIGVGKKLDVKLHLNYYKNDTDQLSKALMLPEFEFKSSLIFMPTDKLNFSADLLSMGNRIPDATSGNTLSGFTDLNLGVRYNINKQFTAFVQANNVLNKSYQYFYYYPVQKLQIMGGVSYRFDIPHN